MKAPITIGYWLLVKWLVVIGYLILIVDYNPLFRQYYTIKGRNVKRNILKKEYRIQETENRVFWNHEAHEKHEEKTE